MASPGAYLLVIAFAYVFAIGPSVLYMAVMEWAFSRGLNPSSWRTVLLSSFLGVFAGIGCSVILAIDRGKGRKWDDADLKLFVMLAIIGLIAGVVVGGIVKLCSPCSMNSVVKSNNPNERQA